MRCRLAPYAIILVGSLFCLVSSSAVASTYYVSPTGSDANPGTAASPWQTIQMAASTMVAGDTALIADGDYPGGIVQNTNGLPGLPITFKAINPGGPVIWGDQTQAIDSFYVTYANYTVVDGLTFQNATRCGIRIDNSDHVVIRRCIAVNNQVQGIFCSFCDDITIEYNECAFSAEQHGIYVSSAADRPIVRYNICHDNARAGIQLNGDGRHANPSLGTKWDGFIEGAQVIGNICYENGQLNMAAAFNVMSVRSSLFANNLLYNNQAGGMSFWNDSVATDTQWGCKDNRILNNTIFFKPVEGRWCLSFTNGSSGNVVQNNIVYGGAHGAYQFDTGSIPIADHNLLLSAGETHVAMDNNSLQLYSLADWQQLTGSDLNSQQLDPLFVSPSSLPFDFHLLAGSPAINGGLWQPDVAVDLDGNARPGAGVSDIGCFQSGVPEAFSISGTATYNGLGIPGVVVTVGNGHTTTSAADGTFVIDGLLPGTYTVTASSPNYSMSAPVAVTLGPNKTNVLFTATTDLLGVTLQQNSVLGTSTVQGQVNIGKPAPPGGTVVTLASSDPGVTVPATIIVRRGDKTAGFTATTSAVSANTAVTISARLGLASGSTTLTVTPPAVSGLSLNPSTVAGGAPATGTVTLNAAAGPGGRVVAISISGNLATVPATVTVQAGANSAQFTIQTATVSTPKSVTITATTGAASASATLNLGVPTLDSVKFDPSSVAGGQISQCTVWLTGPAPTGGFNIKLTSRSKAISFPGSVTIPAGAQKATFTVQTTAVGQNMTATITAALGRNTTVSGDLQLVAPGLSSVSVNPSTITAGSSATGTVTLSAPAGSHGVTVSLSAQRARGDGGDGGDGGGGGDVHDLIKMANQVTISAGATSATFVINTKSKGRHNDVNVVITATAGNSSVTTQITIKRNDH